MRVFVPQPQRRRIIKDQSFEQLDAIAASRIYPEELRERGPELVLTMRGSMTGDLDRADCLSGAAAVWSMWPGYLQKDSGRRLATWLVDRDIALTHTHASGHAGPGDLAALATAIAPERVVPIHTDAPHRYSKLYDRVEAHSDGEWWAV